MDTLLTELKSLYMYNPFNGFFYRKKDSSAYKAGSVVGSDDGSGYIILKISGKNKKAHRLAWLYVYGYSPENQIDHINRCRSDNKINNLREVSPSCNIKNRNIQYNNSSGVTGVSLRMGRRIFVAQIGNNNKNIVIGRFDNKEDAVKARWEAEKKYGYQNCCTTSTAFNYLKEKGLI